MSESQFDSEEAESDKYDEDADEMASNDLKLSDTTAENENGVEDEEEQEEEEEQQEEAARADLGSGWGRIIYMPVRRGKRVELDICRATNSEGTKGSFGRVVITQSKNPKLHHQARRSIWGDLWPLRSEKDSK